LFVVLLLPGFAYVAIRERSTPNRAISPFRETVNMAIVSILALLGGSAGLALGRFFLPAYTPDVGLILSDGLGDYADDDYPLLFTWGIAMLVVPTAVAGGVALVLRNKTPHPSSSSAWWILFDAWPNKRHIEVTCALDDGSWVRGRARYFNDSSQDVADRDFILEDPISIALPGPGEEFQRFDTSAVCVSARRIVSMYVTYIDPDEAAEPTSSPGSTEVSADQAASTEVDPAGQVELPVAAAQ
jgi:hypothetical protein